MPQQSLYQVLSIDPSSSQDQIKQAFRGLAKIWHPDKHQNKTVAEPKFKEISAAYAVLSDPRARAAYDKERNKAQIQAMTVEEMLAAFVGKAAKYDCPGIDELADACGA